MGAFVQVDRHELLAFMDELDRIARARANQTATAADLAQLAEMEERVRKWVPALRRPQEKRRSHRFQCTLPGWVRQDGQTAAGIVRDVSAGGVFVEASLPAKENDAVLLSIDAPEGGMWIPCRVAWVAKRRPVGLGLEFESDEASRDARIRMLVVEVLRQQFSGS